MSPAFFIYEYLITFDREVNLFWSRPKSVATVLFIANRYAFLLSNAFLPALFAPNGALSEEVSILSISEKECTLTDETSKV